MDAQLESKSRHGGRRSCLWCLQPVGDAEDCWKQRHAPVRGYEDGYTFMHKKCFDLLWFLAADLNFVYRYAPHDVSEQISKLVHEAKNKLMEADMDDWPDEGRGRQAVE